MFNITWKINKTFTSVNPVRSTLGTPFSLKLINYILFVLLYIYIEILLEFNTLKLRPLQLHPTAYIKRERPLSLGRAARR